MNPPASCSWAGGAVAHGASAYAYAYPSVAYGQSCASYAQWRTCSNGSLSGSYGYSACSVNPPANCSWAGGTVAHGGSATAYQASTVPYGSSCVSQTRSCSNGSLSGSYGYPSCSVTPGANCTFNGSPVAHGTSVTAYAASTVPYGSTCAPQSQTRTCTNGTLSGTYTYSSCSVTPPASCTFAGTPVAHGASVTAYQTSTVPAGSSCTDVTQTRSCTNGTLSGTYTQASCNDNCTFNGDTVAHGDSVTAYQSSWVTSGSSCSAPETRTCTDGTLSGTNAFSSCMVGNPAACNFSGYAWSDNTGWLDMDGIVADTDGTMFGYGWSDILGWVSANPSDLIDCPIAPCIAEMDGSNINGWLRALSGSHSQSGDWGGWIRLHDTTYGVSLTEGGTLSGYGWGDDVVGWMDFEYAQTSCQPCQEKWECSGETIVHTSPQCTVTNVDTCELPSFCSAGSSICLLPPITFIQSGDKTGHLQLKPQLVVRGRSTKVYWNVDNVESCTVTGGNNSWTGKKSDPSGQVSNPINQQTVFTLSCTGLDGSNIRETATVGVVPVFQEI